MAETAPRGRGRGVYGEQSNRLRERWTTGQRLERYLYDHRWTKYRLAAASGVSLQTLYRMCGGDDVGNVRTWRRVADALGVTVDALLNYTGEAPE